MAIPYQVKKYIEKHNVSIHKMTIKEWLDKLTDENWHNERMIVEAIIDGRTEIMTQAVLIWLQHQACGHMPYELVELRNKLYKDMEKE